MPHRWYDPSRIRVVDRLHLSDDGAVGELDDEPTADAPAGQPGNGARGMVDVHNVNHPETRNHGRASGLSFGFTSHYRAMRDMFGVHVTDGIAGENVLVDADRLLTADELAGAALRTRHGREVPFEEVRAAEPCVEFSRFVLQIPRGEAGEAMRKPLQQLRGGIRGFYVALAEPVELIAGDQLVLR